MFNFDFTAVITVIMAFFRRDAKPSDFVIRHISMCLKALTSESDAVLAIQMLDDLESSLGRRKDGAAPWIESASQHGLTIDDLESLVFIMTAFLVERVFDDVDAMLSPELEEIRALLPGRYRVNPSHEKAARILYHERKAEELQTVWIEPFQTVGFCRVSNGIRRIVGRVELGRLAFHDATAGWRFAEIRGPRKGGGLWIRNGSVAEPWKPAPRGIAMKASTLALVREKRAIDAFGTKFVPRGIGLHDTLFDVSTMPTDRNGDVADSYWRGRGRAKFPPKDDRVERTMVRSFTTKAGEIVTLPAFGWRDGDWESAGHWEPVESEHPAMALAWAAIAATKSGEAALRKFDLNRHRKAGDKVRLPERRPGRLWCSTNRPGREAWRLLRQDAERIGESGWEPSKPARAVGAALRALLAPVVTRRDDDGEEVKVARPLDDEARARLAAKLVRYASKGGSGSGSLWRDALGAVIRALAAIDGYGEPPRKGGPAFVPCALRVTPAAPVRTHAAVTADDLRAMMLAADRAAGERAAVRDAVKAALAAPVRELPPMPFDAPAPNVWRDGRGIWRRTSANPIARNRAILLAAWRAHDPAFAIELADAFGARAAVANSSPLIERRPYFYRPAVERAADVARRVLDRAAVIRWQRDTADDAVAIWSGFWAGVAGHRQTAKGLAKSFVAMSGGERWPEPAARPVSPVPPVPPTRPLGRPFPVIGRTVIEHRPMRLTRPEQRVKPEWEVRREERRAARVARALAGRAEIERLRAAREEREFWRRLDLLSRLHWPARAQRLGIRR